MGRTLLLISSFVAIFCLGPSESRAAQVQQIDTCVDCHSQLDDTSWSEPVRLLQGDIHKRKGLSCANCHGGDSTQLDPERSMDPGKGFIGKPSTNTIATFCGKCHSDAEFMKGYNPKLRVDQAAEYATSVHGKLAAKGDKNVATCISCHGTHGIRAVSEATAPVYPLKVAETCGRCHSNAEYMGRYKIPTDQAAKYARSVHADALLKRQDLSAPTCNDCHGNHGAAPPGVRSVANVCGACHDRQSELFQKSPHEAAFEALGIGQCLACHSNHEITHPTDELLGVGSQAACTVCHNDGEPGFAAAKVMRQGIDDLDHHFKLARQVLDRASAAGMEVSRAKFDLTASQDKLIDARVIIHAFSADEVGRAIKPGIEGAMKAQQSGEQALAELQFRRKGLAASLIVIGIAILSIYLKIRQLEG